MIGQQELQEQLARYDLASFPHAILITGEKGSGKRTLTDLIYTKLKTLLPHVEKETVCDINSEEFNQDAVREYIEKLFYTKSTFGLYVFDFCSRPEIRTGKNYGKESWKRTDKLQFTMLKFTEQPINNIYIVILCEDKSHLLNTLVNRCSIFNMKPYSREELQQFTADETLLDILRTPGQLLSTTSEAVKKCSEVTDTIANKIRTVNLPNLLKVVDMINYKDEFDKIDFNLFFDVLANKLFNMYKNENNLDLLTYYLFVINERKKLKTNQQTLVIDKERFVEHFLVKFWEVAHGM